MQFEQSGWMSGFERTTRGRLRTTVIITDRHEWFFFLKDLCYKDTTKTSEVNILGVRKKCLIPEPEF